MATSKKGSGTEKCTAPVGPFRLLVPDPFFGPTLKLSCDKALACSDDSIFILPVSPPTADGMRHLISHFSDLLPDELTRLLDLASELKEAAPRGSRDALAAGSGIGVAVRKTFFANACQL